MLDSVKIQKRQSEIRQSLNDLVKKEQPTEDETRSMDQLQSEYATNETRFQAALVAEDTERREAKEDLETRSDKEWSELMDQFEVRQVVMALHEGHVINGQTQEIVSELRSQGGYQGVPIPWEALETRAGETVAVGTPDPIRTAPIIDRLFPGSCAAQMGAQMISIDSGEREWPVTTQGASVGWQATETGTVGAAQEFQTVDKALAPDNTLGVNMKITRKTMKQSGAALEQAVRRDMNNAMSVEMDRVVFLGSGAAGQPLGVIPGLATYGITTTAVSASATWGAFRARVVEFMNKNAANGPGSVRALVRNELWDFMDDQEAFTSTGITEWQRFSQNMGSIAMTNNCLDAPSGSPLATEVLLTTNAGGVAPVYVGKWGAVDLIRDVYTEAQSGILNLTALATMDVTVARGLQLEHLSDVQIA